VYLKRKVQALSCHQCCSGKAIGITYCECMFVALSIQHTMRMRPIILSVACPPLHFLTNGTIFEKNDTLLDIKCVFRFFVQILSATFLILSRTERDIIKNVYCSARQVSVIFVRF